jgi:hypothetical protein
MVKTPTGHWRLSLLGKGIAHELYPGLAEAALGELVRRSEELARCEALIDPQSARRERPDLEVNLTGSLLKRRRWGPASRISGINRLLVSPERGHARP